tara:strand:+ start:52029 stop:52646 length:618 start_codon:yes stop_codon:yes gene_type:complete
MDEANLALLERVSAVYMKYGIKSVTMDDLARELGISKKTIYKYFNDKKELVMSIIEMKVELNKAICINCQQNSNNAIDGLNSLSELVIGHLKDVNPTVFYDLKKYHPEAMSIMEAHKWDFVYSMIKENIQRGIKEKIYRSDLNVNIVAKLYISATDSIMNGTIFPWPEFKFQDLFNELIIFHIKGMVNEKGREYLKHDSNFNHEN